MKKLLLFLLLLPMAVFAQTGNKKFPEKITGHWYIHTLITQSDTVHVTDFASYRSTMLKILGSLFDEEMTGTDSALLETKLVRDFKSLQSSVIDITSDSITMSMLLEEELVQEAVHYSYNSADGKIIATSTEGNIEEDAEYYVTADGNLVMVIVSDEEGSITCIYARKPPMKKK